MFCNMCGTPVTEAANSDSTVVSKLEGVSTDFVGRDAEVQRLSSALDDVQVGKGQLVMLAGEPGIGKTRTVDETAAHAESRGFVVLRGACYEEQIVPAYWPWMQALRTYIVNSDPEVLAVQMGEGAAYISEILPSIHDVIPSLTRPSNMDPQTARYHLFDSIAAFFKNASSTQPLMIFLDDLHWADKPSLLLLEFLVTELLEAHVLLVGTYRDVELSRQHPLADSLAQLVRAKSFQRISLSGMSESEVRRMVEKSSESIPDSMIQTVYEHTGGNPFFVTEVTALLAQEDKGKGSSASTQFRVPEGIREVVGRRLNRLSDEANRVLAIASIIGREFDFRVLESLNADVGEDELLEALDDALEASVIKDIPGSPDRYEFAHALIQQTLYEELSTSRRIRLHGRIAESLKLVHSDDIESHASELAFHFSEAEPVVGSEQLIRYSMMAGHQALGTYAFEDALSHFQRSLDAMGDGPMHEEMPEALFGLGKSQSALSQFDAARDSLTRSFNIFDEAGGKDRAVAVAESLPPGMAMLGMIELTERALELVPAGSIHEGWILSRHGLDLGRMQHDYLGAEQAFAKALVIARSNNDVALEMRSLANSADVDNFYLKWDESMEKCESVIELSDSGDDLYAEALAHRWATELSVKRGNSTKAMVHAAACRVAAERLNNHYRLEQAYIVSTWAYQVVGDWDKARKFNDLAMNYAVTTMPSSLFSARARIEYQTGNIAGGRVQLERLISDIKQPSSQLAGAATVQITYLAMVAWLFDDREALELARAEVGQKASESRILPSNQFLLDVSAALLSIADSSKESAIRQREKLLPFQGIYVGNTGISVDRILGLLSRTVGELDSARTHFEDAIAFCRKAGYRPELAWTLHDYSESILQLGAPPDRQMVPNMLSEAQKITADLGMVPLGEKIAELAQQAPGGSASSPARKDGLTAREVEVLGLIASGNTDQQIADQLVVSRRTVNNHVRSIYNKIGASNRAGAATYATRHGLA